MRKLALFTTFVLLLAACQKENGENPILAEKTQVDVAYGANNSQKMDIYLPAGRNSATTKVIILVHGGGWSTGDKTDFTPFIDTLKRRLPGYAIFNLNYRLSNGTTNPFPAQENDIRAAIEFIYNNRSGYNISDKYVMMGVSAGAHLSLLQAYKYTTPIKIKAVVDFFGPADLIDMYNNPASIFAPPSALATVVGGTPATHLSLYQQSSPITFVSSQSAPTIILHGGLDPLVSYNQAVALKSQLQLLGVTHQYVFYPTEAHGWFGANMTDSFDKIVLFLNANVN